MDTERERRACELEHRAILVKVNSVLEEYRNTEKRLRNHITKARSVNKYTLHNMVVLHNFLVCEFSVSQEILVISIRNILESHV